MARRFAEQLQQFRHDRGGGAAEHPVVLESSPPPSPTGSTKRRASSPVTDFVQETPPRLRVRPSTTTTTTTTTTTSPTRPMRLGSSPRRGKAANGAAVDSSPAKTSAAKRRLVASDTDSSGGEAASGSSPVKRRGSNGTGKKGGSAAQPIALPSDDDEAQEDEEEEVWHTKKEPGTKAAKAAPKGRVRAPATSGKRPAATKAKTAAAPKKQAARRHKASDDDDNDDNDNDDDEAEYRGDRKKGKKSKAATRGKPSKGRDAPKARRSRSDEDDDGSDLDSFIDDNSSVEELSGSDASDSDEQEAAADDDEDELMTRRPKATRSSARVSSDRRGARLRKQADSDSDDDRARRKAARAKRRRVADSDGDSDGEGGDLPSMTDAFREGDEMASLSNAVKTLSSVFPKVNKDRIRALLLEKDLDADKVGALLGGEQPALATVASDPIVLEDDEEKQPERPAKQKAPFIDYGPAHDEDELTVRRRVVKFFNDSSFDTMAALSSNANAATIVSLRPFEDFAHLARTFASRPEADLRSILAKYKASLKEVAAVDNVMEQCEGVSALLREALNDLHGDDGNDDQARGDGVVSLVSSPRKGAPASASLPSDFILQQPSTITEGLHLKDYQIAGLNWMNLLRKQQLGGILADEMGLGKTAQVISFLAHLLLQGVKGPHLIVVPSSTLANWQRELRLWCPALVVQVFHGSQKERVALRNEISFAFQDALGDNDEVDEDDEDAEEETGSSDGEQANGKQDSDDNVKVTGSSSTAPAAFNKPGDHGQTAADLPFNVLLTTYGMVCGKQDRSMFRRIPFEYLILDEGHLVKNFASQRYNKLMRIRARLRLLMTGTPLQNDLNELISLLTFIMPTLFQKEIHELQRLFSLAREATQAVIDDRIKRAKRLMAPFVLRRLKSQVLNQLPKKIQHLQYCDMVPDQQQAYAQLMQESRATFKAMKGSRNTKSLSHTLAYLRQLANHLCLHRWFYNDQMLAEMSKAILKDANYYDSHADKVFEDMCIMSDFELSRLCKSSPPLRRYAMDDARLMLSGKVQFLRTLLPQLQRDDHRVLLFSQFKLMLDVLEPVLRQLGMTFVRLDGDTPIQERQVLIDRFNNEQSIFVFLLSTRAGGFGINLTAADVVILHDIDFNPHTDRQAEDRCHRVGQTREVHVYKLIAKDTIEEQIYEGAERKLRLDKDVSAGTATSDAKAASATLDFLKKQLST